MQAARSRGTLSLEAAPGPRSCRVDSEAGVPCSLSRTEHCLSTVQTSSKLPFTPIALSHPASHGMFLVFPGIPSQRAAWQLNLVLGLLPGKAFDLESLY